MPAPTIAIFIVYFFAPRPRNGSFDASAEQPRRAVPERRIRPDLRPRGVSWDLRPVDRAGWQARPGRGQAPARVAHAPAAAAALAARAGAARARSALLDRRPRLRPRFPRPRVGRPAARRRPPARRDRLTPV